MVGLICGGGLQAAALIANRLLQQQPKVVAVS